MTEPAQRALSVLVVDDEPPARDLLRQYLEELPGYRLVGECGDGFAAVKAVDELDPDVLLLDVQMPKLDGFEVLELLETPPQVVFTTAHDEYALRAFEVSAVDYLLKPFSAERLAEALAKAAASLDRGERPAVSELARRHRERAAPLTRLLVREGAKVHVLPTHEIDWIEAQSDYIEIHRQGRAFRKKQTLAELDGLLGPDFVRIHRGYLLNIDRLRSIEPYAKDSRLAFLEDGTRLPISRAGYERLRKFL